MDLAILLGVVRVLFGILGDLYGLSIHGDLVGDLAGVPAGIAAGDMDGEWTLIGPDIITAITEGSTMDSFMEITTLEIVEKPTSILLEEVMDQGLSQSKEAEAEVKQPLVLITDCRIQTMEIQE